MCVFIVYGELNIIVCVFQEYRDAFVLFDKRGDNKIDSQQIGDVMRALGLNPTEAEIKKVQQEMDPSGESLSPRLLDGYVRRLCLIGIY